jgi:hypothetical protein
MTLLLEAPTTAPPAHRRLSRQLPDGWPLIALFLLFPLWWALGLATFIYVILAVPMAVHLWRWRPVRLPPGFGLWALFLVWQVVAISMLGVDPLGTVPDTWSGRLIGYGTRLASYLALTVLLLYVGNLSERQMPQRRLVSLVAWMFGVTVAGGLLGVLAPHFEFTSPLEYLLPGSIRSNGYVQSLVHPASSQIQTVLGYSAPRPKAPYDYTNSWGNGLSVTGNWFVALFAMGGLTRRRWLRWTLAPVIAGLVAVTAIYSLNRGLWLGIGLSVLYLAIRLAAQRKLALLGMLASMICVTAVVVPATPLGGLITGRLENGKSNEIRASLTAQTFSTVRHSPVLGYGSTRNAYGSPSSLAVGKSASCPQCGNFPIGSTGQLWLVLISTGYGGAILYFGFFGYGIWRYRHDGSKIGIAGGLSLWLSLLYALFYNAVPMALAFYLVSYGLLWRNDQQSDVSESELSP